MPTCFTWCSFVWFWFRLRSVTEACSTRMDYRVACHRVLGDPLHSFPRTGKQPLSPFTHGLARGLCHYYTRNVFTLPRYNPSKWSLGRECRNCIIANISPRGFLRSKSEIPSTQAPWAAATQPSVPSLNSGLSEWTLRPESLFSFIQFLSSLALF